MQDNAPGHAAKATQQELVEREVPLIHWPSFSPDLNLIEAVWNLMKEWIQEHYGDEEKLSYDRLRQAVREAWDSITEEQFGSLLDSMHDRCQAVINANGLFTRF